MTPGFYRDAERFIADDGGIIEQREDGRIGVYTNPRGSRRSLEYASLMAIQSDQHAVQFILPIQVLVEFIRDGGMDYWQAIQHLNRTRTSANEYRQARDVLRMAAFGSTDEPPPFQEGT